VSDTNFDIDFDLEDVETPPRRSSPIFTFILEWWRSIDRVNFGLFLGLLSIGAILSMATSPVAAARIDRDSPFYFFFRHLIFVFMGLGGAVFVSCFSPQNAFMVLLLKARRVGYA